MYLVHCGDDLEVPLEERKLDFRTVFAVDDQTGACAKRRERSAPLTPRSCSAGDIMKMPVVGLLRPLGAPAAAAVAGGAATASAESASSRADMLYEESWDLPFDAHLCISWDYLYVATPDQMDSSEDLAYEWLKRNRYKLRPDGSMTGTPLRLDLDADEVARLIQQHEEEERASYMLPSEAAAAAAAEKAQAEKEALEQLEREGLSEELDIPDVDLM